MFRVWVKEFSDNHLLKDLVIENGGDATRTAKVLAALEEACAKLDLPVPIWLDVNIREFRLTAKARFRQDAFMEAVPFDYLEFQVIEED